MSLSDLLITVVRKPDGEGHAVLTVRTDKGDFVLDNLTDAVSQWDTTGYRFLKRQATDHTGRWVTIREGNERAGRLGQVAVRFARRSSRHCRRRDVLRDLPDACPDGSSAPARSDLLRHAACASRSPAMR